ncbi:hypothetical protein SCA6_020275 [Theobroma cacao]
MKESISDAKRKEKVKIALVITMLSVFGMLLFGVAGWCNFQVRGKMRARNGNNMFWDAKEQYQKEDLELPLFDLSTVSAATSKFSFEQKIGEGGFGPVYKGVLPTGKEIAVKRLSKNSGQGLQEFKNEVILISKLQHRNLVKLLGCCIQGEERIGYMSPEYAMSGRFSVKSDVFSYGVLVLEIVSGKKNWGFRHPDHDLSLLGHAWKLWNEGNPLELMDEFMEDSFSANEVVRCIQVGLLCVQQRTEDRPMMSSVVMMLSNESTLLSKPKEPGFCAEILGTDTSSGKNLCTAHELTVTALSGR